MSARPDPRSEHYREHLDGHDSEHASSTAPHRVTYFISFCDVPLFLDCTCGADGDHVDVYPLYEELFAAPLARLWRRLRARFAHVSNSMLDRELRQLLDMHPQRPDEAGPATAVSPS